jgi:hypothetical protein
MSTERKQVEFVYAGAVLHKGEVMHSYIEHTDGKLGDASLYSDALSHHVPGSIVQFTQVRSAIVKESALFQGVWSADPAQVTAWQAMTTALVASETAYKEQRKNPMLDALEPLRNAYAVMGARERVVLIAAVSAYIAGED